MIGLSRCVEMSPVSNYILYKIPLGTFFIIKSNTNFVLRSVVVKDLLIY